MQTRRVDVAVIGAGTAGLSARREAAKAGARVVMIERGPYGTTCARVGCMPSKLLIAAADVAHEIARAGLFGLGVPSAPRVDGPMVLERVRRERDRFVGFVVESTEDLPEEQRLRGRARFIGPTTLAVDDHTVVEARAVVVATGSVPWIPPSLAAVRDRVLVNDDVFELEDLPDSLAVVGTGIIGLEIGQALHRLGVRTAFFSHSDRLGPVTDPEVRESVAATLGGELTLHLNARLEATPSKDGGVVMRWTGSDGVPQEARFARVLAAAGRRPDLESLELTVAGVATDARGVPRFDARTMQCGDRPIFIAGDAAADRPLLHEAADEGRIAGLNAARFPHVRAESRRTPLAIVFTDPQMAAVGCRYEALDLDEVEIGAVSYADQGRARVMGKNAGCVRIYARRDSGKLVGAEMFGPRVENTAHLLAWLVQLDVSVGRALELPFYHPVVEEGIRTGLRDLCARLKIREAVRPADLEGGPGT
jgi:dihydrolipoamide dehydrogenase